MLSRVDAPSRSPRVTDEDRVFDDAPLDEPIHPTTLGNMRSLGVRRLFAAVVAPSGARPLGWLPPIANTERATLPAHPMINP